MTPLTPDSPLIAALRAEHFEHDRPLLKCLPPMLNVSSRIEWNAQARQDRSMFTIAQQLLGETEFGFRVLIEDAVSLDDAKFLLDRLQDAQRRYRLAQETLQAAKPIVRRMIRELQQRPF